MSIDTVVIDNVKIRETLKKAIGLLTVERAVRISDMQEWFTENDEWLESVKDRANKCETQLWSLMKKANIEGDSNTLYELENAHKVPFDYFLKQRVRSTTFASDIRCAREAFDINKLERFFTKTHDKLLASYDASLLLAESAIHPFPVKRDFMVELAIVAENRRHQPPLSKITDVQDWLYAEKVEVDDRLKKAKTDLDKVVIKPKKIEPPTPSPEVRTDIGSYEKERLERLQESRDAIGRKYIPGLEKEPEVSPIKWLTALAVLIVVGFIVGMILRG